MEFKGTEVWRKIQCISSVPPVISSGLSLHSDGEKREMNLAVRWRGGNTCNELSNGPVEDMFLLK